MPREHGRTEKGRREGKTGGRQTEGHSLREEGAERKRCDQPAQKWSKKGKKNYFGALEIDVLSVPWQYDDEDAERLHTRFSVSGIS